MKHMGAWGVEHLDSSTQGRVGRGQKASLKDGGGPSQSTATAEEGIWGHYTQPPETQNKAGWVCQA